MSPAGSPAPGRPPALPDARSLHPAAAVGFERAAEAYERGRPSFPADAVEFVSETLGLAARPGVRVLELGAGTGKLTRLIAPTSASVVALEPVEAMRRVFADAVPACAALGGIAEALPFRDGSFNAAAASQVFHWLDGDVAVPELARVLVPTAHVALVWNVRDEAHPWVRELTDVIEPFRGDTPTHRSERWRIAFDASPAFTPLERVSFPYAHRTTRDAVVDRMTSISFIATLRDAERDGVAAAVRSVLAAEGAEAPDDPVVFPYRTDVWITTRR
jgi:SAM-dependent methyltransferase